MRTDFRASLTTAEPQQTTPNFGFPLSRLCDTNRTFSSKNCVWNRKFSVALFPLLTAAFLMSQAPQAFAEQFSDAARLNLTRLYLELSLANEKRVLQKIASPSFKYWPNCISKDRKKCDRATLNEIFRRSVERHFRLTFVYEKSKPELYSIYTDAAAARQQKEKFDRLYVNDFRDSNDVDCQLYYDLRGNTINRVVLVVSLDATDFKQRTCLALQLNRGLGLALPRGEPFSVLWSLGPDDEDSLGHLNEEKLSALIRSYGLLSYLHMCSDLKAGMNAEAVAIVLRDDSCWRGLVKARKRLKTELLQGRN